MLKNSTRWGWNQADGVWFFFELGRETPMLCPLKAPSNLLFCPHRTPSNMTPLPHKEPAIYWTTKPVVFMPELNVKHSRIKYFGVQTVREMAAMSSETNYIPIVVSSVRVTQDWYMFTLKLEQLVETYGRSVVLELVDEFVPLSPEWKELKNLKSLGLERYRNE